MKVTSVGPDIRIAVDANQRWDVGAAIDWMTALAPYRPAQLVQHLSMFDFVAVSGSLDDRVIEYVHHLHEHFVDPVVMRGGAYQVPTAPGFSAQLRPSVFEQYTYPDGTAWA